MSDLAKEAGVPRETLYDSFRNKPEVFHALIGRFTDDALTAIEDGLTDVDDLADQLDVVFEQMTVRPGDVLDAMTSSGTLIEGFETTARAALEQSFGRFQRMFESILAPYAETLSGRGLSVQGLANHVCRCAGRIGNSVPDREDRIAQLATLRSLCVAATVT